jgi:uncharacterized membrane-anchored protein YjiN (DUF445 family)
MEGPGGQSIGGEQRSMDQAPKLAERPQVGMSTAPVAVSARRTKAARWRVLFGQSRQSELPASFPLSRADALAAVDAVDLAERVGSWLVRDDNVSRVAEQITARIPILTSTIEFRELGRDIVALFQQELGTIDLAPVLGCAMRVISRSEAADRVLDRLLDQFVDLAFANADVIQRAIARKQAWWMPSAVDRQITHAILAGLDEFVIGLRAPDSSDRAAMRAHFQQIATALVDKEERTELHQLHQYFIADPEMRSALATVLRQLRDDFLSSRSLDQTAASAQPSLVAALEALGRALLRDEGLRRQSNQLLAPLVAFLSRELPGSAAAERAGHHDPHAPAATLIRGPLAGALLGFGLGLGLGQLGFVLR